MYKLNEFTEAGFWEMLNPDLSITTNPFADKSKEYDIDDSEVDRCVQQVMEEGYFQTSPVINKNEVEPVANAIKKIVDYGLPPVFVFVYDEVWQYFGRLSRLLEPVLDENYKINIAGMWAWYIDEHGAGFEPHRDKGTIDNLPDGRPSNLTLWVPFTDATPLNGCMYVLPTSLDPNYPGNLTNMKVGDVSSIRALPAAAGSILAWDACILHWGAKSSRWADHPRISISMDFSRNDPGLKTDIYTNYGNGPELHAHHSVELPFKARLNAIGEAIWTYRTRVIGLYLNAVDMLFEFCRLYALSPEQQSRVSLEAPKLILKRDVLELIKKHKYSEALPVIQGICKSHPGDLDAHHILCTVLFSLNMNDETVKAVRRALAVFPNHQGMRELLFNVEKECESRHNKSRVN